MPLKNASGNTLMTSASTKTCARCFPINFSIEYRSVICAFDFIIPISFPKSIVKTIAGLCKLLFISAVRIVPTQISTFIKSSKEMLFIYLQILKYYIAINSHKS